MWWDGGFSQSIATAPPTCFLALADLCSILSHKWAWWVCTWHFATIDIGCLKYAYSILFLSAGFRGASEAVWSSRWKACYVGMCCFRRLSVLYFRDQKHWCSPYKQRQSVPIWNLFLWTNAKGLLKHIGWHAEGFSAEWDVIASVSVTGTCGWCYATLGCAIPIGLAGRWDLIEYQASREAWRCEATDSVLKGPHISSRWNLLFQATGIFIRSALLFRCQILQRIILYFRIPESLDVSQWHTVKETPLRVSLKAAWALDLRTERLRLIVFPSPRSSDSFFK